VWVACPTCFIPLDLIVLIKCGSEYELWSSSFCNFLQSPAIPSLSGPHVLLSALFSKCLTVYYLRLSQSGSSGVGRRVVSEVTEKHDAFIIRVELLHTHADFLLCLVFNPEDGGNIFLRNARWLSPDYMAFCHRRYNYFILYGLLLSRQTKFHTHTEQQVELLMYIGLFQPSRLRYKVSYLLSFPRYRCLKSWHYFWSTL
jgi:hypothetical protein